MKLLAGDVLLDTQKSESEKLENEKVESDRAFRKNGGHVKKAAGHKGLAAGKAHVSHGSHKIEAHVKLGKRSKTGHATSAASKNAKHSKLGLGEKTGQEKALGKEIQKDVDMIKSVKIKAKGSAKIEARLKADAQRKKLGELNGQSV